MFISTIRLALGSSKKAYGLSKNPISQRRQYASYAFWQMMHRDDSREEVSFKKTSYSNICNEQVVPVKSGTSDDLQSDLASDNTFLFLDDLMKERLLNFYSTPESPCSYTAQKIRGRLPPQLKLGHLGPLVKKAKDFLPLLEDDSQGVNSAYISHPIPKTIHDIKTLDQDPRAIVITDTKSPYRIIQVNTAWESLCGYKREECKGKAVGPLLHGPETDWAALSIMIFHLLSGEQSYSVLTNYTKNGRKFQNFVTVGPVVDEMGKTVNFVGVLREVTEGTNGERGHSLRRDTATLPFMA